MVVDGIKLGWQNSYNILVELSVNQRSYIRHFIKSPEIVSVTTSVSETRR